MKKSTMMVAMTAVTLLLAMVALFPNLAGAQGQNLLKNPGFEEGHYNQDGIAEITVPNGWRMHWSNNESNIFDGYAVTARPETVVWNIKGAPAGEDELFWKDGIYTVKIFKGWAPMWAAMSQDVSGLEVGRKYRLVAPVYIDIVADYDAGRKVAPQDGRQGRVRLGASPVGATWRDEGAIGYSGWWTGETISPFYQAYPTFIHEFTATAPEMTVWIEMASNYPHPNNGFFVDTVGLYALDEFGGVAAAPAAAPAAAGGEGAASSAPAAQPAAPLPTATPRADGAVVHVVQSGDSFWSLAIKYAATMGITPEEALVQIPEINNNPSVINNGDELIIVPPSAERAAAAAAATEGEEAAPETAEEAAPEATPQAEEAAAEAEQTPAQDGGEETAVTETTVSTTGGGSNLSEAMLQVAPSSICVQVYDDVNGNGTREEAGEAPIADQAVTLSRGGNTVSTYITDGSGDLYCFERLEADTYQVQILPTADYVLTGDDSWAVGMAEGVVIPVSFGLQAASSDVVAAAAAADSAPARGAALPEEAAAPSSSPNTTLIVAGVAGVLVLLAGAGVYLLRRG